MGLEALVTIIKNQEKSVSGQLEISSNFINRYGSHRKIFDDNGFNDTFNFPKAKKYTSNLALLKQKEFENNLFRYSGTVYNLLNWQYPRLEEHLNKLIKMIEEELDKSI